MAAGKNTEFAELPYELIAMKTNQVILVLESDYGSGLMAQWKTVPMWIVDSPSNRRVVEATRALEPEWMITTFPLRDGESRADACERIIDSLDQHHNEFAQRPPYSELVVIGLSLSDVSLKPFVELGFTEFLLTSAGFTARKSMGADSTNPY